MDVIGHFGLTQDPFRASIDPEQAYPSRPFALARQQVLAGLTRGSRLIAVAGGTGAGKTLLLRTIERALGASRSVLRTERPDMAHTALASAAEVLLIDDADALDDRTFAALVDASTLRDGPTVVLACAQRCLDRLPSALGALTVPLPFLDPEESKAFLTDRATRAGGAATLFMPPALDILTEAGRGIPAALRLLGANALFHAAFDGAAHVEEAHARQSVAMTQDMWKGVVAPEAARPVPIAAPVEAPPRPAPVAAAPVVAVAAPVAAAEPLQPAVADELAGRRSWWRNAPPLVRLAMVVALLLLSLPLIGYVVGAIKDERPAADSSYLPDEDEVADASTTAEPEVTRPRAAPAPEPAEVAVATPEPAAEPVRPPRDLIQGAGIAEPALEPPATPVEPQRPAPSAPAEATPAAAEPAAPPERETPAENETATAGARVFVHYSTRQPGADEAAANVARELRDRGFTVVDIRAVPSRIETASVRYFFLDDRAQAEALQDALGSILRSRGFSGGDLKAMTDYRPAPRRGTIEVWVPAD